METIRSLISRLRNTGIPLIIGIILIGYIALGLVYWQQKSMQTTLEGQIAKISQVTSRPMASAEKLKADNKAVNDALASVGDEHAAVSLLVNIARKSGINVDTSAGKLTIPSPTLGTAKVGGDTFGLISFRTVSIVGSDSSVMSLLSDMDSGKTLESMVLKRAVVKYSNIPFTEEELQQKAELRKITAAVKAMMADNRLSRIPNPTSFVFGRAVDLMGDDPNTPLVFEGFPDSTSSLAEKGYTGAGEPRLGYVLYNHDKISSDNTSEYKTVSYVDSLRTRYFYSVEEDGTVHQFRSADLSATNEITVSQIDKSETMATVDIDIYTKKKE